MSPTNLMRRSLNVCRAVSRSLQVKGHEGFPLNRADVLTVALVVFLENATLLEVDDERLRDAFEEAFREEDVKTDIMTGVTDAKDDKAIALIALSRLGNASDRLRLTRSTLVYGLSGLIPTDQFSDAPAELSLLPLSTQAPALWNVGLAWLVPQGAPGASLLAIERLRAAFSDPALDAFSLFERVQELEETLRSRSDRSSGSQERVDQLEQEIAELRRSEMLRDRAPLADAIRRK
jgi:hypothetical protein